MLEEKKKRKRYPKEVIQTRFRKQIDWPKTLENYEKRISICRGVFFFDLHEAYVSDYNIHRKSPEEFQSQSHIPILHKITVHHDVNILGVVSANQKNGKYMYLQEGIPQNAKIVYVGKANFITGKEESRYAIRQKDIVFL